ncbi:YaiO family outer membrane beta-barrel protein [Rubrolithibacter danxiaensis]|uniref:YaiO family outer membrane beta-barrel protein n=1 Tax=Rubrolithibacter danxiaensis TaxID=3390805 RepID=UPI003BF8093D
MIRRTDKGAVISLFFLLFILFSLRGFAQDLGTDELFQQARKEAFDNKDYTKAIKLSKQALDKSPDYTDIRIFLGRIYTWSDKVDSARTEFKKVLDKDPKQAEALSAIFDLEYWNKSFAKALEYAETGVRYHPESEELTIKKAKALNALGRPVEALKIVRSYKEDHPKSEAARELESAIKKANAQNKIGISYTYIDFDKRFDQPWQLANLSYGRSFKGIGMITVGANFARRFNTNGVEIEAESYPSISNGLYAYVGGAVSSSSIFPDYRFGFSLYKTLPGSFEIEGGLRYLNFGSSTTLFVAGVARYFGNTFVGVRSYLTPSDGKLSKSFNLSGKFFLTDDRNDYFNITLGTGISPDDRARRQDITRSLKSFKVSSDYSRNIFKNTTVSIGASWVNEEYTTNEHWNQFYLNGGLQKRF